MNKKKFLATCTLVAFGSTMLPAFAFGAATAASTIDAFTKASTGLVENVTTGIKVTFDGVEETWLSKDDTLVVKVAAGSAVGSEIFEDASAKFAIDAVTAASDPTEGDITIKAVDGATFIPGYYAVSVIDKEDTTKVSDVVVMNAPIAKSTVVSAAGKVTGTTIATPAKVNLITVTNADMGSNTKVFDLGTSGYARVAEGAEAVATASSNEISAEKLIAGHFYAVVGTGDTMAADTYPAVVFEYTQDVADEVQKAIDAAQAQVDGDLAKVPAEITVELVDDSTNIILCGSGKAINPTALKFANNKNGAFIASGLMVGNDQVIEADTFAAGTFTAQNNVIATKAYPLVAKGDVTGTIIVAVQNSATKAIAEKEVTITLTAPKTDQETMAAYANKYLSNYNAGIAADLTDDTATLTVSAVDKGFNLKDSTATLTLDPVSYTLGKYFDATTGKVTKLPEQNITEQVVLNFGGSISGKITVDLTIKAAGQTGDLEQLEKEYRAAETVVLDKIAELNTAEGKLTVAQLNELYKAYKPYKEAKAAYNAAKGE